MSSPETFACYLEHGLPWHWITSQGIYTLHVQETLPSHGTAPAATARRIYDLRETCWVTGNNRSVRKVVAPALDQTPFYPAMTGDLSALAAITGTALTPFSGPPGLIMALLNHGHDVMHDIVINDVAYSLVLQCEDRLDTMPVLSCYTLKVPLSCSAADAPFWTQARAILAGSHICQLFQEALSDPVPIVSLFLLPGW